MMLRRTDNEGLNKNDGSGSEQPATSHRPVDVGAPIKMPSVPLRALSKYVAREEEQFFNDLPRELQLSYLDERAFALAIDFIGGLIRDKQLVNEIMRAEYLVGDASRSRDDLAGRIGTDLRLGCEEVIALVIANTMTRMLAIDRITQHVPTTSPRARAQIIAIGFGYDAA